MNALRSAAAATLLLVSAACSGNTLGTLGDIIGASPAPSSGQSGELQVEVRGIDTQRQVIQVATQQGQTGSILYDQNTAVVYRQQQYPVSALERGDIVRMRVQETSQGSLYASRIDVEQSVQERTGTTGSLQQFAGRVGGVDYDRGLFMLQTQSGNYTISLPYNPPQTTLDYFRRLRTGDSVQLEGTPLGNGRIELYRFR